MSGLDAGALPHSAPGKDGETLQLASFEMRHNADIIGVKIGGVITLESKADLEFARQISRSVERFDFALRLRNVRNLFAVEPNFVISGCLGLQIFGDESNNRL